jgi:hypothetical protein
MRQSSLHLVLEEKKTRFINQANNISPIVEICEAQVTYRSSRDVETTFSGRWISKKRERWIVSDRSMWITVR